MLKWNLSSLYDMCDKFYGGGPFCPPLVSKADHTPSNFWKAVFHKFYLVDSWILCPKICYYKHNLLVQGQQ